ncbi:MAG: hypothetical protein U9Q76_07900 [candidate division WOR-3 bacterium]|nr:hypothetical protein [candidate division WOR-3 bacterium]
MAPRLSLRKRLWGALWGALLGVILGTACSSAIEPIVNAPWLKGLLVKGIEVGLPEFTTSLGFFNLTFGFSFRFTLLSGLFMLGVAALMLFLPFRED